MEEADGEAMMGVVLGALARVHALEHTVFALMASHPRPDVALHAWDGSLPSWTDGVSQYLEVPEFSRVFRERTSQNRLTLERTVEQWTKRQGSAQP